MSGRITRREALGGMLAVGAAVGLGGRLAAQTMPLITRAIPSTGEQLPVIGIGTNRWGVGSSEQARAPLRAMLERFSALGGKVIDTAAEYGSSENVIGDLTAELGLRDRLFLATKVRETGRQAGISSMQSSLSDLRAEPLDLMQIHEMLGLETHLPVLREWKEAGRFRYIGVTTARRYQDAALERFMSRETIDFVQLSYSLEDRAAAERLLPLAADRGIAVLVNMPFGQGSVFRAVAGRPLPEWASELDCESWAQFFLKYIVAHPAVTCAIPGTRQEAHLLDNLGAAQGRLPDAELRRRQEAFFDSLS